MAPSMEDVRKPGTGRDRRGSRRPEPEAQERRYLLISVDDHVVEPPGLFVDRVSRSMRDLVPRVMEGERGDQYWLVDGEARPFTGADSVVGWEPDGIDDYMLPMRYEEMRPASYDPDARVRDMDIDGVSASLAFPSMVWGFCGQRVWGLADPAVAQGCVRAYNDWVAEEWSGTHPERLIPNQIVYLPDPGVAAEEVRRNAGRGFRAVCLSENPERLGLPSIHTRHWDPLLEACEETGTVVNLHLGSSSSRPYASSDAPVAVSSMMWPAHVMCAAAEWVYSQVCVRYPQLRLAFSEGGVGWVPVLLQRMERAHRMRAQMTGWPDGDLAPMDVFRRNFWFCAIDEPYSFDQRYRFGVDRILLESDYPHSDTSWPATQAAVHEQIKDLPPEEIALVTHGNAAALYGHPLPTSPEWLPTRPAPVP
jgi:predicted TIM-barrel fold metal-dependent hydrolase